MTILAVSDCPNTSHSDSAVMVSLGDEPATQLSAFETSSETLSSDFETGIHSSHQITSDTSTPAPCIHTHTHMYARTHARTHTCTHVHTRAHTPLIVLGNAEN